MSERDTLSMLHKIGPTNRSELVALVEGCSLSMLNKMERDGTVKRYLGDADLVVATNAGLKMIGIHGKRIAPSRLIVEKDTYDGAELKPFTGRAGCNDALLAPSRQFNKLYYRDVTCASV